MKPNRSASSLAVLTIGAVGVVYGDIGTSPLYALKEVFAHGRVPLTEANIYGVLSMIFWTLMVVVSLKYVSLMLRADNGGEGGTIALLSLASTAVRSRPELRRRLLLLGIFGTAIFFGDGVITPAISVMSAIEGLKVAAPGLQPYVVPLALLVLTALFAVQRFGTAGIGRFFGPVTVVWFLALTALGLMHIVDKPQVLAALSPGHAFGFLFSQPRIAFIALGSVFLVVTGAEALYADLGHFGKRPIRLAWFGLVGPALVINYFGQGAMLLEHPEKAGNPFYEMAPGWAIYPLIALATLATVIASQAVITAAFSITKHASQLGYLPRMRVEHTSEKETGQVYLPFVNSALYVCIVAAVIGFGSSDALASAYGIAVTTVMLITTTLTFFIIRYAWGLPWIVCVAATGFFFLVDAVFFGANIVKVADGGWFPLLIGGLLFTLMMTWKQGRKLLTRSMRNDAIDLESFLKSVFLSPPVRVPGTAVFLSAENDLTPNALLHNLKHNKVLHERNLFVTVKHHEVPWVEEGSRCEIKDLGHDCWQVTLGFGFKNEPDVPAALARLRSSGCVVDDMDTSYFLSRDIIVPTMGSGMADWREKLFVGMHRNASAAADFLRLPTNRVVELGSKVEI